MLIRSERPADVTAISDLLAVAFAVPDSEGAPVPEVSLVEALRGSGAWIPQQSLVATIDEDVVGYCLCTRAHVGDLPCLGLGPLAVTPERQGKGIGTALVHEAVDIAVEMGEPLIALLGDIAYYSRFGFEPCRNLGIDPPEPSWGDYFQVKRLPAFIPVQGQFRYPPPFQGLD